MLAKPRYPFSKEFNFLQDGKIIGEFRAPLSLYLSASRRPSLMVNGKTYAVNLPYLFLSSSNRAECKLELLDNDKSIAIVNRPDASSTNSFNVDFEDKKFRVEFEGFGKHSFYDGDQPIGEIRYKNLLMRSKTIDLPSSVPLVIQVFSFLATFLTPASYSDI
jgi:hypothetical protein